MPRTERVIKKQAQDGGSESDHAIKVGMRMTRQDRKARKKKTPVRAVIEMDHFDPNLEEKLNQH